MKANLIEHISVEILTIISQLTPKQFDLLLNSLNFFYFFTFVSHQHRNFYVVECQYLSNTFSFIIQNTAAQQKDETYAINFQPRKYVSEL